MGNLTTGTTLNFRGFAFGEPMLDLNKVYVNGPITFNNITTGGNFSLDSSGNPITISGTITGGAASHTVTITDGAEGLKIARSALEELYPMLDLFH